MEPLIIALICSASFGAIVVLSAFVRQLLLSRDKRLNDEAQRLAVTQEAEELEKMRTQLYNHTRFESHEKILGANKDGIIYLDNKINEIFTKRQQVLERYAQLSVKESNSILNGDVSPERKQVCDRLKKEIDEEVRLYDLELAQLQQRRSVLLEAQRDIDKYLLTQEQSRKEILDSIYKQHSGILEKVYLRHTDNAEVVAKNTIEAGTTSFKAMILAPIQFLLQYFNLSTGINLDHSQIEQKARDDVKNTEDSVNEKDNPDSEDHAPRPDDEDKIPDGGWSSESDEEAFTFRA